MPPSGAERPAISSDVERVLRERGPALLAIDGVEGIAAGRNAIGDDAITIFLHDAGAGASIPAQLDGVPVQTIVTGPIDAL
jgi:hypothetical protein